MSPLGWDAPADLQKDPATIPDRATPVAEGLRAEIESYLETHGIVVFHSHPRAGDTSAPVYWDTERHPDYKLFLAAAESAGK